MDVLGRQQHAGNAAQSNTDDLVGGDRLVQQEYPHGSRDDGVEGR